MDISGIFTIFFPQYNGDGTLAGFAAGEYNPYYTIRTQDNLSVGGSTARFLGWSASGANLVQEQGVSDTLRKAVVFQSPTAEVKAIYKGRLQKQAVNRARNGGLLAMFQSRRFFISSMNPQAKSGLPTQPTAAQVGDPSCCLTKARVHTAGRSLNLLQQFTG